LNCIGIKIKRGERGDCFSPKKKIDKEEVEKGGRGQASNHKLNITNEIILMITSSAILYVEMQRHRVICFIKSHCNTLYNAVGIYQ